MRSKATFREADFSGLTEATQKKKANSGRSEAHSAGTNATQQSCRFIFLPIARSLELEHFGISSANGYQLLVTSLLRDFSVIEDQDAICHANGGKAMRDDE